jgi:hypothetical protein
MINTERFETLQQWQVYSGEASAMDGWVPMLLYLGCKNEAGGNQRVDQIPHVDGLASPSSTA